MKPRKWRKLLAAGLVWTLGLLVIVFIVASWEAADYLIAPAPSRVIWPENAGPAPQTVTITATDGVHLAGWWMPVTNSTRAVVLLHGVDANRFAVLSRARWLRGQGYNVLLYDARGHGESDRVLKGFGYHETADLMGALGWLEHQGMISIGCLGLSQGAATILMASGKLPPSVHAVVAEEPYDTLQDAVDDHFRSWTGLPSGYWGALVVPMAEWKVGFTLGQASPLHEIPSLKAPLLLIGGTRDNMAPPADLKKLYEAATDSPELWMVEGAGHVDFDTRLGDAYRQRVGSFLARNLAEPASVARLNSTSPQTPGVPPREGTVPVPR